MAIKFINTKHFGQIIGDVEETLSTNVYVVKKAAYVQIQQDPTTGNMGSAMMAVMKAFVEDDVLYLNVDDIVGNHLYTPSTDIYNQYQDRFGSGLILDKSPLIK